MDCLALKGNGLLYKCSATAKLIMTMFLIGAVMVTDHLTVLGLPAATVLVLLLLSRLPLGRMLTYTIYPAFFAVIFALSARSISFWTLLVPAKAMVAALSVMLLIGTTSFVEIFGVLRKFLPGLLADGLFMTYRSFFILLRSMANFFRSIRLRGGYSPFRLVGNIKNLVQGMAVLFLHAWEMAERMYDIMNLRGYNGQIAVARSAQVIWPGDLLPVGLGITVFTLAVIM